jgi:glycosyltransferase involved in cell wall biosynthesis
LKTKYKRLKLILKDLSSLYDISAESHVSVLEAFADGKFHTQEILSDIILISNNLTLDQLQGLYGAADCYVSPYRAEGFGLTPLEAAACGTPIIVSKGGATDDYFHPCMGAQVDSQLTTRDGRTELDPDLDSLIEKMESLLMAAENEKTRKFRSKHVHENFSWSKVTEMLWSEFQLKSQQKPE